MVAGCCLRLLEVVLDVAGGCWGLLQVVLVLARGCWRLLEVVLVVAGGFFLRNIFSGGWVGVGGSVVVGQSPN